MNIGLMPLTDTDSEKGKCAFKAIQYMSLGIPAVVSPVGTNRTVVSNNVNGFWAENDDEWFETIERLLTDSELRITMGASARKEIEERFSVNSSVTLFLTCLNRCMLDNRSNKTSVIQCVSM